MNVRLVILAVLIAIMTGCASTSRPKAQPDALYGERSPRGGVGIALAGGGTKAASYAMGVLAAVADSTSGFKGVDVISTVSGGGYSAFYLYSKMLLRDQDPGVRPKDNELFADCLPEVYADNLPESSSGKYEGTPPLCKVCEGTPPVCTVDNREKYKFQQFVRCRQDVLENDCAQQLKKGEAAEYNRSLINTVGLVTLTGLMATPNFIARTAFDWPINLAPSRYAYLEGIGTAYGLYPLNASALAETSNILSSCDKARFLNCDKEQGYARLSRDAKGRSVTFDELATLTRNSGGNVPTWVINATASRSRSVFGWGTKGQRDFSRFTLQMSPFTARSGFYHEVPEYSQDMDVLQAVTTSAAFLDSNETASWQPLRLLLGVGQHLLDLDWGVDINNPNVSDHWRYLHSALPIGFYYLDGWMRWLGNVPENQHSGYIRLLDGGNNDNLGAYTLYEAGVKDIFISDHSQDGKGEMKDMCILRNEIILRSAGEKTLLLPGLENFAEQCGAFIHDSGCFDDNERTNCKAVAQQIKVASSKGSYPINNWKYPVILGCIKKADGTNQCGDDAEQRIYLLKPALDFSTFIDTYVAGDKVKSNACDGRTPGVCEVAAYIAKESSYRGGMGKFPQDGTVSTTFASTGRKFGAYRELARWQMSEALKLRDRSLFANELKKQANMPIERVK